jgi:hypothetical protein
MSDGTVTKAGYQADISCGAKRLVDAANSGSSCGTATNIAQATTITTGQSFTYAGFNVNECRKQCKRYYAAGKYDVV